MHIFIDFDRTLINSSKICDDVFAAYGDSAIHEHYKTFRANGPFNVIAFCDYASEQGLDGARLQDHFFTHAHHGDRYIFPDAISFLQQLKSNGHELHLLTRAPDIDRWQKPKVDSSGLVPFLDHVHITTGKKIDVISSLKLDQPFVFIDDMQTEIEHMQNAFPESVCIKHLPGTPLADHLIKIDQIKK